MNMINSGAKWTIRKKKHAMSETHNQPALSNEHSSISFDKSKSGLDFSAALDGQQGYLRCKSCRYWKVDAHGII